MIILRRPRASLLCAIALFAVGLLLVVQGHRPLSLSRSAFASPSSTTGSCCRHHHHHHRSPRDVSVRALPPDPTNVLSSLNDAMTQAGPLPADAVTPEQILVGFIAGVFPFVWAAWEFWKRIDTQQRCGVCQGSGLVNIGRTGKALKYPQKCYACGGFLPWQGWRRFWLSNLDIGNGGILQRPAADYDKLSTEAKRQRGEDPSKKY